MKPEDKYTHTPLPSRAVLIFHHRRLTVTVSIVAVELRHLPSRPAAAAVEIHNCRRRLTVAFPLSIATPIKRVQMPPLPLKGFAHGGWRQVAASGGRRRSLMMVVVVVVVAAAAAAAGGC